MRNTRFTLAISLLSLASLTAAQQMAVTVQSEGSTTQVVVNGVIVHQTPHAVAAVRQTPLPAGGAAVLWTEVHGAGAADVPHYAIVLPGRPASRALATSYDLELAYASFDPLEALPGIPAHLAADASSTLALVQFYTQPLESYQSQLLALGVSIHRLIPDNALLIAGERDALAQVAALPHVRWVGAYPSAFKFSADLLPDVLAASASAAPIECSIEVMSYDFAEQLAVAQRLTQLGGVVINTAPGLRRMTVRMTAQQAIEVAKLDAVHFIDPWGEGGADMDIIRQLGGASPLLETLGYTGQGVRGEVIDTEVQANHPEWAGQVPLYNGPAGGSSQHGTSCYGINFATGVNPAAKGLLPEREQGIYCWSKNATQFGGAFTRLALNTAATDPNGPLRSCYQTSSVGSTQTTTYTTISAETDDYLFQVDYLSTQSQSNTSSQLSRPQAWAKNIVSVGGIDHENTLVRSDDGQSAASFGPASDQRVKPDLAHVYDSIFTTEAGSDYTQFCCTSGATPVTAGHFGLLMQMWHEGVWTGHGGGASVFDSRPKSTTAKALMINGAYRYPLNQNGLTRARQGWGMADLTRLHAERDNTYIVNESHLLAPLGVNTYLIEVDAAAPELAVTLVYLDLPGNPNVQSTHRVNDLSLRVIDPNGVVYWGNQGLQSSNLSSAGGSADSKNTVENVFLQSPAGGVWTVEVLGDQITQDSRVETSQLDADYALVIRGKTATAIGCPGDIDLSGAVDQLDLNLLLVAFGASVGDVNYIAQADLDTSGAIDQDDLNVLLSGFGGVCLN